MAVNSNRLIPLCVSEGQLGMSEKLVITMIVNLQSPKGICRGCAGLSGSIPLVIAKLDAVRNAVLSVEASPTCSSLATQLMYMYVLCL